MAYRRPAVQTGVWDGQTADRAVDGLLDSDGTENRYCAHPNTNTGPAMWTVDLGSNHQLYNVTIYNTENAGGITLSERFFFNLSDCIALICHPYNVCQQKVKPLKTYLYMYRRKHILLLSGVICSIRLILSTHLISLDRFNLQAITDSTTSSCLCLMKT